MKDIEDLFVDNQTSLKLKEIGFDEICFGYYLINGVLTHPLKFDPVYNYEKIKYKAPTIDQVVNWFLEKYDIWISLGREYEKGIFMGFGIEIESNPGVRYLDVYDSPREAYLAAINYIIDNKLTQK